MPGITDLLSGKGKQVRNKVALTALGREKIESVDPTGADGKVLWDIKGHGTESSLGEISERTGFSYHKVKAVCEKLADPKGEFRWLEWV